MKTLITIIAGEDTFVSPSLLAAADIVIRGTNVVKGTRTDLMDAVDHLLLADLGCPDEDAPTCSMSKGTDS